VAVDRAGRFVVCATTREKRPPDTAHVRPVVVETAESRSGCRFAVDASAEMTQRLISVSRCERVSGCCHPAPDVLIRHGCLIGWQNWGKGGLTRCRLKQCRLKRGEWDRLSCYLSYRERDTVNRHATIEIRRAFDWKGRRDDRLRGLRGQLRH